MHYFALLAVEAQDASEAQDKVSEFIYGHPSESDYHTVTEVISMADASGNISPDVLVRIEDVLKWKDARIAEGIRSFVPIMTKEQKVVTTLNPDMDDDLRRRQEMWTEALNTGGRSLSVHRNEDNMNNWFELWQLRQTLKLMGDDFHNLVGFYDIEELTPVLRWVEKRVAADPLAQWLVVVDMHN
jgi:hypothetical protein